jgi:hypothetical protein
MQFELLVVNRVSTVQVNYHKTEDSRILSNSVTVNWIWVSEIPQSAMTFPANCF